MNGAEAEISYERAALKAEVDAALSAVGRLFAKDVATDAYTNMAHLQGNSSVPRPAGSRLSREQLAQWVAAGVGTETSGSSPGSSATLCGVAGGLEAERLQARLASLESERQRSLQRGQRMAAQIERAISALTRATAWQQQQREKEKEEEEEEEDLEGQEAVVAALTTTQEVGDPPPFSPAGMAVGRKPTDAPAHPPTHTQAGRVQPILTVGSSFGSSVAPSNRHDSTQLESDGGGSSIRAMSGGFSQDEISFSSSFGSSSSATGSKPAAVASHIEAGACTINRPLLTMHD